MSSAQSRFLLLFAAVALAAALAMSLTEHVASAATPALLSPARQVLQEMFPQGPIGDLQPSPLAGFQSAIIGGQVAYVSDDGKTVILGNVYQGRTDIGVARLATYRKAELQKIPSASRIVFAPKNPKYTVTVFVDVDCPYCRKFHEQIVAYNRQGIAVEYVLLPLDMHPNAHSKAVAVWCAQDRAAAFTAAMAGGDTGTGNCPTPIDDLKKIGMAVGVSGTPAVFGQDGRHLGGYVTPEELSRELAAPAPGQ
jgi:thiol:disulfide interchange protein DsbC